MSRDATGTYNLPAGNPVVPGTVIATSWCNPTMADLATALTDSLSRSGRGGMGAPLAMGGFRITALGAATAATDAAQATQVRDSAFTLLAPAVSDATGNDYTGIGVLGTTPVTGTTYLFLADKDNTGAMTLSVNGSAAIPILLNGAPVPAGLVLAGSVVVVTFFNLAWRLANAAGVVGTVNSIVSDDTQVLSVATVASVATLSPHTNVAHGLLKLDSVNKVPVSLLPFLDLEFIGVWNAAPGTNPAAADNGQFYLIINPGTLSIYALSVGNVYTVQAIAVVEGDSITYREGSVDVDQPDGWYFIPATTAPVPASNVPITPTPTFPAITDAQTWMDAVDAELLLKLPLAGGTMSGPIVQPAPPSTGTELANKQYVDDSIASGGTVVSSFNTRTGAVTLLSADVTAALAYTPANLAGDTFTGPIVATEVTASGVATALGFVQTPLVAAAAATIDFDDGQSQILTLAAPLTITAINNIPVGSILRLTIFVTTHAITWPVTVNWPLGATPDLALGTLKKAIVVLENDGTVLLASSAAY